MRAALEVPAPPWTVGHLQQPGLLGGIDQFGVAKHPYLIGLALVQVGEGLLLLLHDRRGGRAEHVL